MQKLPIGIYSFDYMRLHDYVYVDKTRYIYQMITEGVFYFLSRPRRFGKSLLVTTLWRLFEGRKELFEGLWIAEHGDWAWEKHPVILLDFNGIPGSTPEELRAGLASRLEQIAVSEEVALKTEAIERQFQSLILALYQKTTMPVVVLIDEYDKRIIDHLGKGEAGMVTAKANRDVLKQFFGVLKDVSVGSVLRFVLLTGVSKFSKVSIFSELNNLYDISMDGDYADLLGYTQAELDGYFADHIARLEQKLGAEVRQELTRYYNGYRFSEAEVKVYNPFSILNALQSKALKNYWFESGTPTFLVNLLREQQVDLPAIEQLQVSQASFTTFEIDNLLPEALLFQTGYVTIQAVEGGIYTLNYPNQEVKTALHESLLFAWAEGMKRATSSHVLHLVQYLQAENLVAFFEAMTAIFAAIPYDIQTKRDEAYYHTIFYLMISASGGQAQSGLLTCQGRIDLVVTFKDKVYIIEFKCNQSAAIALQQIKDKHYADRYRDTGLRIICIGLNFDPETRNIAEWQVENDKSKL